MEYKQKKGIGYINKESKDFIKNKIITKTGDSTVLNDEDDDIPLSCVMFRRSLSKVKKQVETRN